jgi:hypothetical protein
MTPDIKLRTLFVLDGHGRIICTREPEPVPGPLFTLIRTWSSCAWAARTDVPEEISREIDHLASDEPPLRNRQDPPVHADRYLSLVGGEIVSGPAFEFRDPIARHADVAPIDRLELLEHNFRGWTAAEIPGRWPILAVMEGGYPVSVCFSARSSEMAAEAGVETAAWALAIRASGRIPLYSTSWSNTASLAVARKLGLTQYATDWSLLATLKPE